LLADFTYCQGFLYVEKYFLQAMRRPIQTGPAATGEQTVTHDRPGAPDGLERSAARRAALIAVKHECDWTMRRIAAWRGRLDAEDEDLLSDVEEAVKESLRRLSHLADRAEARAARLPGPDDVPGGRPPASRS